MRKIGRFLAGAALSGVCVLANSARAAFINIFDNLPDPTINVSAGDFEGGVNVNGLTAIGLGTSVTASVDETQSFVNVEGDWISQNAGGFIAQPAAEIVNFFEGPNGPLSDVLEYAITPTNPNTGMSHITLYFASDSDPGSPPVLPALPNVGVNPIVSNILETPNGFGAGFVGLSISAVSDVEPVPVPGSAWTGLALLGGLGLVRLARRNRPNMA